MIDLRIQKSEAWQGSEDSLHIKCAEFMKKALLAAGAPQELFFHVPSEGIRKPQYRAKLKMMGFRPGIPDAILLAKSEEYSGLLVELKKAGGSPSPDQRASLTALSKQGFLCLIINDFDTFKKVVSHYTKHIK